MSPLQAARQAYARLVVTKYGKPDDRLIAAFAAVEREHYVGPGPWLVKSGSSGYVQSTDDPLFLYQDILVALDPQRGLNNGQPSLHARCLAACEPRPGDTVLQIGAGTGYYTAILAQLIGPTGQIHAYELEPGLAARARRNLAPLPNVQVIEANACTGPLPPADVIYVSAAATHPVPAWLDALKPGGRLIFPLTPIPGVGCMLLVTRETGDRYAAQAVIGAAFTPCIGACDEKMSARLANAFQKQPVAGVKSLRRNDSPDASAWCVGDGWWLSTDVA